MSLYLSGHLHVQHYKSAESVTEIVTSALSVSPCQYGVLHAENGSVRYEARSVDVSAWARERGREEPELRDFAAYAAAYFDARTRRQVPESLRDFRYSEEEIAVMTEYLCALNRAYFAGDLTDVQRLDPGGEARALWERDATLYGLYAASIREDIGKDYRTWQSG